MNKGKIFSEFSPHKCKLHFLELVYTKNYFHLTKIYVLSYLKGRLIKQCVPDLNWDLAWNFCWMWSVNQIKFREECAILVKKNVYMWAKHKFVMRSLSGKDIPWIGKSLTFQQIKKFHVQWSIKKVLLTIFWDMKGPVTIDFLEKGVTVKNASYWEHQRQYSFFYWMTLVYIYIYI